MPRDQHSEATQAAREARRNPSAAEAIMWQHLRGSRLGFKFRREHPIAGFRLDFCCHEALLCVEMDGDQHSETRDETRDRVLAQLGILTYRIKNQQFFLLGGALFQDHLKRITELCELRSGRKAFPEIP